MIEFEEVDESGLKAEPGKFRLLTDAKRGYLNFGDFATVKQAVAAISYADLGDNPTARIVNDKGEVQELPQTATCPRCSHKFVLE